MQVKVAVSGMPQYQPLNIHQRIAAVMNDAGYIHKVKKDKVPYSIVNYDDVVEKLRPCLIAHGIVVTSSMVSYIQDGNRTELVARVEFINVDNPEDRTSGEYLGYGVDPQDKGPGKAMTYATKQALLKTFLFRSGDDPDLESIDYSAEKIHAKPVSEADTLLASATKAVAFWGKLGVTQARLFQQAGVDSIEAITKDQVEVMRHWAAQTKDGACTVLDIFPEPDAKPKRNQPRMVSMPDMTSEEIDALYTGEMMRDPYVPPKRNQPRALTDDGVES